MALQPETKWYGNRTLEKVRICYINTWASQVALVVRNLPAHTVIKTNRVGERMTFCERAERDFPGGPVVMNLSSNAGGCRFKPWLGNYTGLLQLEKPECLNKGPA